MAKPQRILETVRQIRSGSDNVVSVTFAAPSSDVDDLIDRLRAQDTLIRDLRAQLAESASTVRACVATIHDLLHSVLHQIGVSHESL